MGLYDVVDLKKMDASVSSDRQRQTEKTFAFKWGQQDTYESEAVKAKARQWLLDRYFAGDEERLDMLLGGEGKRILDAGCGSGFTGLLLFGERLNRHDYVGVDISSACDIAKERFAQAGVRGEFLQADISKDIFFPESCDIIYSEGVLHHTDDTRKSFLNLAAALKKDGVIMIYVYAKKAVIREFVDDHVRAALSGHDDEKAWEMLRPLTLLGKTLGDLNVRITVEQDIDLLGIKAGEYDLQRFVYWNIMKLYYDPNYTLEEMNHVNFDWYRPLNCHRHTLNEVQSWCEEAGLVIEHADLQESGITVVARRGND